MTVGTFVSQAHFHLWQVVMFLLFAFCHMVWPWYVTIGMTCCCGAFGPMVACEQRTELNAPVNPVHAHVPKHCRDFLWHMYLIVVW